MFSQESKVVNCVCVFKRKFLGIQLLTKQFSSPNRFFFIAILIALRKLFWKGGGEVRGRGLSGGIGSEFNRETSAAAAILGSSLE